MRNRTLLAAVLCVFAGMASLLHAADQTKLSVIVKSQAGRPIDRASVVIRCVDRKLAKLGKHDCPAYELRTNEEGKAVMPPIPQGKIRVQVIAKGYQTYGKDFEINEDQKTIEITVNPPQQQYSAHQ
jgi:Carboxypeptidase regulatory-like domain